MTVERYLSVRFKRWRMELFKSKTAAIVSVLIGLILFSINLPLALSINYDAQNPNVTCFTSDFNIIDMQVSFFT